MTKFYLKQPIEAEQFDGSDEMISKYSLGHFTDSQSPWINIATLNGENIFVGDWIVTGIDTEYYRIEEEIFDHIYAELPVIPKMVAKYIKTAHSYDLSLFDFFRISFQSKKDIDSEWVCEHFELVARAWLDGYQVEAD